MIRNRIWIVGSLVMALAMALAACAPAATPVVPATAAPVVATKAPEKPKEFNFGMLLVGPRNDGGWSQAHYDAGLYVEKKLTGAKMQYLENVYVGAGGLPQGVTEADAAADMVSKGAKLVIFNSDAMQDKAVEFAKANPSVSVIHASGDSSWKDGVNYKDVPNLYNVMGRMEYGKMMAGCAAALTSQTGKIGYLGPLINSETRRLVSSAYLGAKYCWTNYLGKKAEDLKFKVTWIGFWFYIPGFSTDPTQVADEFYNSGYDVVISGIDTRENLVEAGKMRAQGKTVWAVAYDYWDACAEAKEYCLGVPYFNWGPSYLEQIKKVDSGTFKAGYDWLAPDWKNINNPDTSIVGFTKGAALSAEASATLDKFITALAGGLNLFAGPMKYQDGTAFLAEGAKATDQQIWYLPQLLEGMEGQSVSK
jgi:simple sugar transport system substrate-binding protein